MSKNSLIVRLSAILAGLLPWPASASIHADLGPLQTVFGPLAFILCLGGVALLVAAYLFWKRGQTDWLFACTAIAPGALLSVLRLLGLTSPVVAASIVLGFWPLVGWAVFLVAVFRKKPAQAAT